MLFFTFFIFLILISIISYRRIINPNSIIILWWGGWYLISTLSLTGVDRPSDYTGILTLILLSGFTLGNFLFIPHKKLNINPDYDNPQNNIIYSYYLKIIKYTYIPVFIIFAFFTVKAIYLMNTQGLLYYRTLSFSSERSGGVSALYGNLYIDLFVHYFLESYMYALLLIGTLLSFVFKKYRLLIYPVLLILMYTIMHLGRFQFYYFFFFMISTFLILNKGYRFKKQYLKRTIYIFLISITLVMIIGPARGVEKFKFQAIKDLTVKTLVDYHTMGFVLFDKEISNPKSVINQNITYGLRTIGGITGLFEQFYHKIIDSNYKTLAFYEGTTFEFDKVIGHNKNGAITGNAFYTCLYTFYIDGREPFVFIFPLILGIIMKYNYEKWRLNSSLKGLAYVIGIMFLLFFSIFQSLFESRGIWIAIIYTIVFFSRAKHLKLNENN